MPALIQNRMVNTFRVLGAGVLLALGALMVLKLGLMIARGGETAWIIFFGKGIWAGKPLTYFCWGILHFVGGSILLVSPRYTARDWRQLPGKLMLLAFSLALTLFASEVGVRVWLAAKHQANSLDRLKQIYREGKKPEVHTSHPMSYIIEPTDNPHLVYALQPNLDMDFGHKRVRSNSAGMRADHEYPLARQPNSVRLVGLGDSGMFGWNCEQGEEYMAVLERNLNRRGDGVRYEALNFSVPGYNTQLEVETLRYKALAYQPDIVLVGWCDNDYSLPFFMLEQQNLQRWNRSCLYQLLFNRRHFLDGTEIRFTEQRAFKKEEVLPEISAGTNVDGVRTALQTLKTLSQQHHFHLLVFGPMDATIIQLCRAAGVDYYNTYEKIPVGKYPESYLIHFMHPIPEGHRILSEHLEREISARGWLTPSTH